MVKKTMPSKKTKKKETPLQLANKEIVFLREKLDQSKQVRDEMTKHAKRGFYGKHKGKVRHTVDLTGQEMMYLRAIANYTTPKHGHEEEVQVGMGILSQIID